MSSGWIFLAAMIVAYGVANLLQSIAAARTRMHRTFSPRLLLSLAAHRTYVFGITFQLIGFLLAFLARRDLPLFLVQASVAAGLGVTTLLGVVVLKWKLPLVELLLLALLCFGVSGLVLAAQPAPSRQIGALGDVILVGALVLIAVSGFFAVRLHGAPGSVALGALAGLAFGAAAVAARPLATVPLQLMALQPLLYLLIAHSIVGQLLLGLAMQRGSTTAAVAAMDASAAVPAAAVGLLLLGDRIMPGRGWLAGLGFILTLGAVLGLTRHAEPQHHCATKLARRQAGPHPVTAYHPTRPAARHAAHHGAPEAWQDRPTVPFGADTDPADRSRRTPNPSRPSGRGAYTGRAAVRMTDGRARPERAATT